MPAKDMLSDIQFHYENAGGIASIEAHHPEHGLVGHLYWNTNPNYKGAPMHSVTSVAVSHPRQGIATAMWQEAKKIEPNIQHAPPSQRTAQGKKWVKAVGD